MTTFDPALRPSPPRRPRRPGPRGPRGPAAMVLVALAVLLLSLGYGLTLVPGIGGLGLLVLVPAGVLLLVGLNATVRDDLDTEG